MSLQGHGNSFQEKKIQENSPYREPRMRTADSRSLCLTDNADSNTTLGNKHQSEKLEIGSQKHSVLGLRLLAKTNRKFFETKRNNESTSAWPFNLALGPSILQSLTTLPEEQNVDSIRNIAQNEPSAGKDSSLLDRKPKQLAFASQIKKDKRMSQNTKQHGLRPRLLKNLEFGSKGPPLKRHQSQPVPSKHLARGLMERARSSSAERKEVPQKRSYGRSFPNIQETVRLEVSQDNRFFSPSPDDGNESKSLNAVAVCRGASVDVPGTPSNRKRWHRRKKSYQLPPVEKRADILYFQQQFRNPSSVILTGKWAIPVHGSIILLKSPLLAQRLKRSRQNAVYKVKGLNGSITAVPGHRKRHIRILKCGNKIREIPVTFFSIEKPPRAVFEFLKLFYPQCEFDLHSLGIWSEVMALSDLCREYDVAGGATVIEKCMEYMMITMRDQTLEELISLDIGSRFHLELKEQIAGFIVSKLISGQISAKDMDKFGVKKWKKIMNSKAWSSRTSNAGYGQLVITTLEWIALNDSQISKRELIYFLDCISGYPRNTEAIDSFIRAIKSDLVESVVSITKRLRSPLQIEFWRRISDYIFRLSDLGFVLS